MYLLALILGCIGCGVYAIAKRALPIGPRRKVIDRPAIWVGVSLVALPFAAVLVFVVWRWGAATYYPGSHLAEQWSVFGPMIVFLLSIACCLTIAKRWSVPNYYTGAWNDYTPIQRTAPSPDFSMFDKLDKAEQDADDGG